MQDSPFDVPLYQLIAQYTQKIPFPRMNKEFKKNGILDFVFSSRQIEKAGDSYGQSYDSQVYQNTL